MTDNFKIYGAVEAPYTQVPKALIKDTSISCEARVILEFLIDLTGNFSVNEHGLSTILGITEYRVKRAVIELEAAGYIRRRRYRIMNGAKFGGWFWDISAYPIFKSDLQRVDNQLVENQMSEIQPVENRFEIQPVENQLSENQLVENQPYIEDRKDTRPTDIRLKEEKTEVEETEGREPTLELTPLYQAEEPIISSAELNINQAFNRFCEVYPSFRLDNEKKMRAAFFAIPDIDKICWQIVNSVEWYLKSGKWDNWQTGQKNVSCPGAVRFLKERRWEAYLKSGATMTVKDRLDALLPDEDDNYEIN